MYVIARIRESLKTMLEADQLAHQFSAAPSRQLRVYGLPSFALSQLAPIIPEFLLLNPKIRLDLQLGTEKIDSVEVGVDVVLGLGRANDSALRVAENCRQRFGQFAQHRHI